MKIGDLVRFRDFPEEICVVTKVCPKLGDVDVTIDLIRVQDGAVLVCRRPSAFERVQCK